MIVCDSWQLVLLAPRSYFEAQPARYSSLPASEALPLTVDPATKSQTDTLCGNGRLQVLVDRRFCTGQAEESFAIGSDGCWRKIRLRRIQWEIVVARKNAKLLQSA